MLDQSPIHISAWSNAPARTGDAQHWCEALCQQAEVEASLRFDLGFVDLNDPVEVAAVTALAALRSQTLYGFSLRLRAQHAITPDQAKLIATAGVTEVTLAQVEDAADDPVLQNMLALQSLRALSDQKIATDWAVCALEMSQEQIAQLAKTLRHLPPPSRIEHSDAAVAEKALAHWQQTHAPETLAYARGPGFLRILDRRSDARSWRFTVLNELQAQILLACREATRAADLAERFNLPPENITQLGQTLSEAGLMMISACGTMVTLVPRRQFSERWASGDH